MELVHEALIKKRKEFEKTLEKFHNEKKKEKCPTCFLPLEERQSEFIYCDYCQNP